MKASRGPIRHGGRRRRERQEKVSPFPLPAAFSAGAPARHHWLAGRPQRSGVGGGAPFCFCLFSPLPQPRRPGSPAAHVAILGGGRRIESAFRDWGLSPASPASPRLPAAWASHRPPARLENPACPLPPSGWTSPSPKTPGRETSRSSVAAVCTLASAPSRPHSLRFH